MHAMTRPAQWLFVWLFAWALPLHADPVEMERSYQLGDRGVLMLTLPAGWRDAIRSAEAKRPATLVFRPLEGAAPFEMLVTPFPPRRLDDPIPTPEWVRQRVINVARRLGDSPVERQIAIEELAGQEAFGSYYRVTDKAPKPGEFRYMAQGMLSFGEVSASFTILTNDGQEDVVTAGLKMLREARFRAAPAEKPD